MISKTRNVNVDYRDVVVPSCRSSRIVLILLALAGIIVAGYLTYVDLSHMNAFCGGPFDCATVQASRFASIRGVPIAILGLLAYVAILILEVAWPHADADAASWMKLGVFAIAFAGMLYSFYLTYVEFFVIHALCVYCLTSAVIISCLAFLSGWRWQKRS